MKSYTRKINVLKRRLNAKASKLSELEREYKYLRKEYHDYCELEVAIRYKVGQILVYETNDPYRTKQEKTIFVYGGTNKSSVEKLGKFALPSDCCAEIGNMPICSACDYECLRLATQEEIDKFKNALLTETYPSIIEEYKEIWKD